MTMIDDHEMEVRAMAMFRRGEGKAASALQDEFLVLWSTGGWKGCRP